MKPGSHVIVQDEQNNVGQGVVVVLHGRGESSGGKVVVEFLDWKLMNGTFLSYGHFSLAEVVPFLTTSYTKLAQLHDSMGNYELAWRSLAKTQTFYDARVSSKPRLESDPLTLLCFAVHSFMSKFLNLEFNIFAHRSHETPR